MCVEQDKFGLSEANNCAELTQRVLDRLDMIMADVPTDLARQFMMAANHLQHARDILDEARAA